jgi:hypothetical protein
MMFLPSFFMSSTLSVSAFYHSFLSRIHHSIMLFNTRIRAGIIHAKASILQSDKSVVGEIMRILLWAPAPRLAYTGRDRK